MDCTVGVTRAYDDKEVNSIVRLHENSHMRFDAIPHTSPGRYDYNGYITSRQIEWLKNDLGNVPEDKL